MSIKKIRYTNQQVESQVINIIRQISDDGWTPDCIVGITRGGLTPAIMLSHWYKNAIMHTLDVRLRDGAGTQTETNCWLAEDAFGSDTVKKNILIVDDINDTGATFDWIKQDWSSSVYNGDSSIWNNSTRFACLVNNMASTFDVNYYAEEINKAEEDVWIEFPWETWYEKW